MTAAETLHLEDLLDKLQMRSIQEMEEENQLLAEFWKKFDDPHEQSEYAQEKDGEEQ
jgi:deoxyadenosine/deoxycytidine kinase